MSNLTLTDIKKVEYLISDLLTPYIKQNYSLYEDFLTYFGRYLDNNNYGKILYIENNLNPYTTFSELLNLFLGEFMSGTFDFDVYDLTEDNQRRFIDFAERLNGLKGTSIGIAFFFRIFVDFSLATSSGQLTVTDFGDVVCDDYTDIADILKYQISINPGTNILSGANSLIDTVNPAGIKSIFKAYLLNPDQSTWVTSGLIAYKPLTETFVIGTTFAIQSIKITPDPNITTVGKQYRYSLTFEVVSGVHGNANIVFDVGSTTYTSGTIGDGTYTLTQTLTSGSDVGLELRIGNIIADYELKITNPTLEELP